MYLFPKWQNTSISRRFQIFPYIAKEPNSSSLNGFLWDMWEIFEETLLFKSIVRTTRYNEGREMIKNYSADVFLAALVYTNQTTNMEFSQPYFRNWYHLYFKLPEGKPATYLHFVAFSGTLWLQMSLFFVFLAISLYLSCVLLSKTARGLEAVLSLPTYFLGVVSAFFNTGYDLRLRSWSGRLQILLALFFGVLCYYALSASLVASLAVLDRPLPFQRIADIASQGSYSLCIRNVTFVYDNFTSEDRSLLPAWRRIVNTDRCPKDMQKWETIPESICTGQVVVLENRIIMAWALHRAQCPVTILPQRLVNFRCLFH
ncbi:uncharacterized protein LOC109546243 [Dendroctonus ponderosae]|uniref:uncharacterized protein LOC109546243 n=1 Tax=Dendroctonus ponderosae TaxID=77166 RepID=UPI0020358AD4|nr:uncharacterized protein LOC109546243 [Dendroctonus ponderosae]